MKESEYLAVSNVTALRIAQNALYFCTFLDDRDEKAIDLRKGVVQLIQTLEAEISIDDEDEE